MKHLIVHGELLPLPLGTDEFYILGRQITAESCGGKVHASRVSELAISPRKAIRVPWRRPSKHGDSRRRFARPESAARRTELRSDCPSSTDS